MEYLEGMLQKEKDNFSRVCNRLLGTCFLCKGNQNTKADYYFVLKYRKEFKEYLGVLGYRLEINEEYGVIQLIGAGLLIEELTGLDFSLIIIIFVLALLAFSLYGGMYGVVVTDTIMFFIMIAVSAVVAPWIISEAGFAEIRGISDRLPGYFTLSGAKNRSLSFTFSQFLVWIIFFTCTPSIVSRVFPAKNDFVILKAALIGVFLAPAMQLPIWISANGMQVLHPGIEQSDRVMIVAFLEHLPPFLGGVGLAALMAAIMSTASTLFVIAGFGLSRDLYQNLRKDALSEVELMRANRIAQLIIGVLVTLIAISKPAAIYWIAVYSGALFGVGWLPTVIAGFEWKRMNHLAGLSSMICGVTSFIAITEMEKVGLINLPNMLDPLMVSFSISVLSLIITALLTRPSAYEIDYFKTVKNTKGSSDTIAQFMTSESGLQNLKKEYRSVQFVIYVVIFLAIILWSFFFLNLAF